MPRSARENCRIFLQTGISLSTPADTKYQWPVLYGHIVEGTRHACKRIEEVAHNVLDSAKDSSDGFAMTALRQQPLEMTPEEKDNRTDASSHTIHTGRFAMHALISQMIRSFHGYVYESAGVINGFFDDPQTARDCARLIQAQVSSEVEVCGCKLAVSVW